MAAVVNIMEWNGDQSAPTSGSKTGGTVRWKKADNLTVDINNPLVKPTAGSDRSYDKWLRLRCEGTAPTGQITNIQFYTDGGSLGTGITVYAKTTNSGSYKSPEIPASDTGYTDASTYVVGSRKNMLTVNAGPFTTAFTDMGDFLMIHMTIGTTVTAPQNPTTSQTLTFTYDET